MKERFGRKGTEVKGIFFTEGQFDNCTFISDAATTSQQQNISLDILKERLADEAISKGANAIDNFKYVQKATIFSFSDTKWVVTGRFVAATD